MVIIMGFKKNLTAFFTIGLMGTVSHFVYNWSGKNWFLGLFFPVNESIWEHLKLIFFPALAYFILEYFSINKKPENYIPAAISGVFCGVISIMVLYYTISGIIGKSVDFINILIYFTAVIITIYKREKIIAKSEEYSSKIIKTILTITIISAFLFMFWSHNPPMLGIFKVPN